MDAAALRITEMVPTYVKDTFSSKPANTDFTTLTTQEELLIKEGEFYLPRNDAPIYH